MVKIDIMSDPICPWCYIGKTYLDRALAQRPDAQINLRWHPFQLNPEMHASGIDRRTYLEQKFGGKNQAINAYAPVVQHGVDAEIPMNLDKILRTPNTLDAHRVIHWAGLEDHQNDVVDGLFRAYFVDGRDLGDSEVLADIADAAGMDASVVLRLLSGESDRKEIVERDASARGMGVTSVPTFIVASQHAVPGAQPTDLWLQVIDELVASA